MTLILNVIGILFNIIGVIMGYIYSPINEHTIDGGTVEIDFNKIKSRTKK